jgi:hypothetical protein
VLVAVSLSLAGMPKDHHEGVSKIIKAWFNGAELHDAWVAAQKPVTWGQIQRVTKPMRDEREERQRRRARKRRRDDEESGDDDAADVATPPPPAASASSRKRKQPPRTQEKAPAAAVPGGSARTGQIKPAVLRRTSLQVSKQLDVDRAYRMEYETAHKAAQAEYLAAREAGIHRKPPNRVSFACACACLQLYSGLSTVFVHSERISRLQFSSTVHTARSHRPQKCNHDLATVTYLGRVA